MSVRDLAGDERAGLADEVIAAGVDVAEKPGAGAVRGPIGIGAVFASL